VEEDDAILAALSSLEAGGGADAVAERGADAGAGGDVVPAWVHDRPEMLGCRVRSVAVPKAPAAQTTGAVPGAGDEARHGRAHAASRFAAEAAEEARAARWRRRARMAVQVRRGEKLLLEEIADDLERLARE